MSKVSSPTMLELRRAIEASWGKDTAYLEVFEKGNPALGNCYPTAGAIQYYFPQTEIVEGEVQTPSSTEKHFWNLLINDGVEYHINLSWQQFPAGSFVKTYKVRDRNELGDSERTVLRIETFLKRVSDQLENH